MFVDTDSFFERENDQNESSYAYSKDSFFDRIGELQVQPVGNDEQLRRAALAFEQVLQNDEAPIEAFHEARLKRMQAGGGLRSISALLMLLSHNVNNVFFQQGIYNFPQLWRLTHPDQSFVVANYRDLFTHLISNHFDEYVKPLDVEHIRTTETGRYAAISGILHTFFPNKSGTWVDVGASAGFGMKRVLSPTDQLIALDPFDLVDQTPDRLITRFLDQPPCIEKSIAVDLDDPLATEEGRRWFFACAMPKLVTPQALRHKDSQMKLYPTLPIPQYEFRVGNISNIPIPEGSADVITAITTLTHLTEEQRRDGIAHMITRLKPDPNSMLIVQDYAVEGSPDNGLHGLSLIQTRDSYGTWICSGLTNWQFMQLLQFENSLCRGVARPGVHYDQIMQRLEGNR